MKHLFSLLALTIGFSMNAQTASGDYSTAMGFETTASGDYSTAMGKKTTASGTASTAMGEQTEASRDYSIAMGYDTRASGYASTAMGSITTAGGYASTAMGASTTASDFGSLVIGQYNSSGSTPTSADSFSLANTAFVIGNGEYPNLSDAFKVMFNGNTTAAGSVTATSFIGDGSQLSNLPSASIAFSDLNSKPTTLDGYGITDAGTGILSAVTENSITGVRLSTSLAANHGDIGGNAVDLSYSVYSSTTLGATGYRSIAMGEETTASGVASSAMGKETIASGSRSTAMGKKTTASGASSIAMGDETIASGASSIAMGEDTTASGSRSTAMGKETEASGNYSTAIGQRTTASGSRSIAMGKETTASGTISTAMGEYTTASGSRSTAIGYYTTASGSRSTAIGYYTTASDWASMVIGQYNSSGSNVTSATSFSSAAPAFVIGNGEGSDDKSDAFKVMFNGNTTVGNDLTVEGDVVISSDARLKANIVSLGATLAKLLLIDGKSFTMKKDGKQKIGVLAQDIQKVFPELVSTDDRDMLAVNYQGLVPVLINALKEQDSKMKEQEKRLERLEAIISKMDK